MREHPIRPAEIGHGLMLEMSGAGEDHCRIGFVGRLDSLLIPLGTTRLNDRRDAPLIPAVIL